MDACANIGIIAQADACVNETQPCAKQGISQKTQCKHNTYPYKAVTHILNSSILHFHFEVEKLTKRVTCARVKVHGETNLSGKTLIYLRPHTNPSPKGEGRDLGSESVLGDFPNFSRIYIPSEKS